MVGGIVFAGAALAWILPPTTPRGGPTVAELARSPALASVRSLSLLDVEPFPPDRAPASDRMVPVAYDPMLPRVSLTRSRTEPGGDDFEPLEPYPEQVDSGGFAADERHARRAFQRGYRHAARKAITDPNDCALLAAWPEEDGCLAYVSEEGRRDEPDDTYDP